MSIGQGTTFKDGLLHYPIKYAVLHQRYELDPAYEPRDYDIALIRTSSPFEFNEYPPYINIERLPRNYEAYMYSRGKAGTANYLPHPKRVRYIKVQDNNRDCELQEEYRNTDITMCYYLISIQDSISQGRYAETFPGDSGAPIIADDLYDKHKRYLIGIHTRYNPVSAYNGETVRAGVNIASFIEWIHYVVNNKVSDYEIDLFGGKTVCCDSDIERQIKWPIPLSQRKFLNITVWDYPG